MPLSSDFGGHRVTVALWSENRESSQISSHQNIEERELCQRPMGSQISKDIRGRAELGSEHHQDDSQQREVGLTADIKVERLDKSAAADAHGRTIPRF